MSRTDCHRPIELDPVNYTYYGWLYQGHSDDVCEDISAEMRDRSNENDNYCDLKFIRNHPELFHGNYAEKQSCDHCGAFFHWGVIFRHTPTNNLIVIGHQCAERLNFPNRAAFLRHQLESRAATIAANKKIQAAAQAWIDARPEFTSILAKDATPVHCILRDLQKNLWKWGNLTDRQVDLVKKLLSETEQAKIKTQKEAALDAVAQPVPITDKRVQITGEVLGRKRQESSFGYKQMEYKMLVRDDRGFKLWGTIPSNIFDIDHGSRITFTATVMPSKEDPKFGFFSRPTKAQILIDSILISTD